MLNKGRVIMFRFQHNADCTATVARKGRSTATFVYIINQPTLTRILSRNMLYLNSENTLSAPETRHVIYMFTFT